MIEQILEKGKLISVQVEVETIEIDIDTPYIIKDNSKSYGSGFFISHNLILTNHHVIEDAIRIFIRIPKFKKKNFKAVIKCYNIEKDFAVLEIKDYTNTNELFKIGDPNELKQGNDVYILGYPLGNINPNLKIVSGMVTGWERNRIQHDANTNKGNSGGMVLNENMEIIGIETSALVGNGINNTNYAIPINIVKPSKLIKDYANGDKVRIQNLNINFTGQKTTDDIVTKITGKTFNDIGVLVNRVICKNKNSILGVGDIVLKINNYEINNYCEVNFTNNIINNFNYSKLAEYYDIGDTYAITFYSRKEKKEITETHTWLPLNQICESYINKINPILEGVDYEIFGGMIVMELSKNHIQHFINLEHIQLICKYSKYLLQPQNKKLLIITHLFPSTNIYENEILEIGDTLCKVNKLKVRTLKEYRDAIKLSLQKNDNLILIQNGDNKVDIINTENLKENEIELSKRFSYPLSTLFNIEEKEEEEKKEEEKSWLFRKLE